MTFDLKHLNPFRTMKVLGGLEESIRLPFLMSSPQSRTAFYLRTHVRKRVYDEDVPKWLEFESVTIPDGVDVDTLVGDLNEWLSDRRLEGRYPLGVKRHPRTDLCVQIHWNVLPKRKC